MASGLAISYFLTWVAVPLLAERFIDERHAVERPPGRLGHWTAERYARSLDFLLRKPLRVLIGVIPLLLLGLIAYRQVGTGFMPNMDGRVSSSTTVPNLVPHSPKPIACWARSKRSSAPIRTWTPIRGAPACSSAAVSPKRTPAISSSA